MWRFHASTLSLYRDAAPEVCYGAVEGGVPDIVAHRTSAAQIRAMMVIYDDTVGLESFMQKAVKISQRLTACQLGETAASPV